MGGGLWCPLTDLGTKSLSVQQVPALISEGKGTGTTGNDDSIRGTGKLTLRYPQMVGLLNIRDKLSKPTAFMREVVHNANAGIPNKNIQPKPGKVVSKHDA